METSAGPYGNEPAAAGGAVPGAVALVPDAAAEVLHDGFERLCLTPYQSRVIVALLQLGSATCVEVARVSGVPRTSVYQVLDELDGKGVACRLAGPGVAVWAPVGRRDVLDRLVSSEQERLTQLTARSARVREMLDQLLPADGAGPCLPFVNVIHDPAGVQPSFEQLLSQTQHELLVCNRPPYGETARPGPALHETVGRAATRVLSEPARPGDAGHQQWRQEKAMWHQAGAAVRVVDDLPFRLALFDRRVSLLTLDQPPSSALASSVTVHIEHPGYTGVLAGVFEMLWESAPVRDGR